ncbi:3792_t:CDS:10 [Diversispora eburnea]|uniref:3792_t:CDS:1 n=1 Tax=Diversispora eburnea TaxID=1213867 RepID=A0A9N9GE42_9GLOM|nr:3792_t:CDS:10 [Diversispora eburnea]
MDGSRVTDTTKRSNPQSNPEYEPKPPPHSEPPQNPQPSQHTQHHHQHQHRHRHRSQHQNSNIDRSYTPKLKFTNFSAQAPIVTKYVTSKFLRHDLEQEGSKVIVIHPGSKYLKIGRASEAFPYIVPNVIARQVTNWKQDDTEKMNIDDIQNENVKNENVKDKNNSEKEDKDLMNENNDSTPENWSGSRRPVANAQTQVLSFNKSSQPEIIADHNDPYKVDWTNVEEGIECYVGEKALRLANSENDYKLFYPIQHGEFNSRDYNSIKAVTHSVILIIPDVYNRLYVSEMVTMLLRYMEFRRVFVAQESVCVSFGAGISVACVVDIGAQTTSVTCVEDGMCIPDSRICLHYGGDDITTFFIRLLRKSKFPYSEIDLNRMYDWLLAEEMKEKFCTLDEANLSIQLNEFYVRAPNNPTIKYQIKTYDDAIMAPMCIFYPHVINFQKKLAEFPPKFVSQAIDDITEGVIAATVPPPGPVAQKPKSSASTQIKSSFPSPSPQPRDSPGPATPLRLDNVTTSTNGPSTPSATTSSTRNHNGFHLEPTTTLPLDDAIIQSINAATGEDRVKKFYSSLLLVGGGGLIPGIHKMLEERLSVRQASDKFEVLGSPRDMDPRLLAWKGGSVMSKLEIVSELWINSGEWEELGVRCLREKALFVW